MDQIWKSNRSRTLKIRLLISTVEAVLLYGCETWSLSKKQEQELGGCYTRMLRKALNISWREHVTMNCYMGTYQKFQLIRTRRLKLVRHCARHPNEAASNLVPDRGSRGRGHSSSSRWRMDIYDLRRHAQNSASKTAVVCLASLRSR